jgi:hypothetical protein
MWKRNGERERIGKNEFFISRSFSFHFFPPSYFFFLFYFLNIKSTGLFVPEFIFVTPCAFFFQERKKKKILREYVFIPSKATKKRICMACTIFLLCYAVFL